MAIAFVSSTSKVGTPDSVTTNAINTTGANFLVVGISLDAGGTVALSDSKGNTWVALGAQTQGSVKSVLYYSINPTVGTGHTFTNAGSQNYCSIFVQAFSGVHATAPFDQQQGDSSGGDAFIITPLISPTESNELFITHYAINGTGLPINPNNAPFLETFTMTDDEEFGAGNNYGGGIAYFIQGAADPFQVQWTRSVSGDPSAGRIASFKIAAGISASSSISSSISTSPSSSISSSVSLSPSSSVSPSSSISQSPSPSLSPSPSISSSISSSPSSSISASPSLSISSSISLSPSSSRSSSISSSVSSSPSSSISGSPSPSVSPSLSASPSLSVSTSPSLSASNSASVSSSPSPSLAIGVILGRNNDTGVIVGTSID